jgi:hypothetical protein
MNAPAAPPDGKALNGVLLVALFAGGIALVREGPHFDTVLNGWVFFAGTFTAGLLGGYTGWTLTFGLAPKLKFSGVHRQPLLAALAFGLIAAVMASTLNRVYASATDRAIVAPIDTIAEGKAERWYLTVKMPDGSYHRYRITKDVAADLKNERTVRLGIAHGMLGFDYIARFERAQR